MHLIGMLRTLVLLLNQRIVIKRRPRIIQSYRDTPRGYLPVYVGEEKERMLIKIKHLNRSPQLAALLDRLARDFGYAQRGILWLQDCNAATVAHLVQPPLASSSSSSSSSSTPRCSTLTPSSRAPLSTTKKATVGLSQKRKLPKTTPSINASFL